MPATLRHGRRTQQEQGVHCGEGVTGGLPGPTVLAVLSLGNHPPLRAPIHSQRETVWLGDDSRTGLLRRQPDQHDQHGIPEKVSGNLSEPTPHHDPLRAPGHPYTGWANELQTGEGC